jgi:hypothetical protein
MWKAVLVLLLVGLALALRLVLSGDSRGDTATASTATPAPLATAGEVEFDPQVLTMRKPAPVMTRGHPGTEVSGPDSPGGPVGLHGTIVAIDEAGNERREEDGLLAFELDAGGVRAHHEVEVRDGSWNAKLGEEPGRTVGSLSVGGCILGSRTAVPGAEARALAIPADGRLELRVRWLTDILLHVRARDSGRELDDVFIYELPPVQRGSSRDMLHPGRDARAMGRELGPSPVRIDAREGDWIEPHILYATSSGYAWGRIELDARKVEEHTLLLDPSGELELLISVLGGEPWDLSAEIQLFRSAVQDAQEFLDVPLGRSRAFVLEALPAGHYTAQARSYGSLLGMVEVEVTADQRLQATLELGQPSVRFVPFEGTLVLPAEWSTEWGLDDFSLDFSLQGRFDNGGRQGSFRIGRSEMVLEEGSPQRFRWSASALGDTRYRVRLNHVDYVVELDTGPSGTRDARIELPAPGHVSLRLVDDRSGEEVESEGVSYAPLTPRAFKVWNFVKLTGGSRANPWKFRVPQGDILVLTRPNLYEQAARVVKVGPGRNELVLQLRRKP